MENKKNSNLFLYGIRDFLPGNEDKINYCLPIIEDSKSCFFVAINGNWDINSEKGIAKYDISEWESKEYFTKIDSEKEIPIIPSQNPVLIGPGFSKWLNQAYSENQKEFLGRIYPIQKDFLITLSDSSFYENICSKISNDSRKLFDQEISLHKGKTISEKAESYLGLLSGTGTSDEREVYLRFLASLKIKGEDNNYRDLLKLASHDLDMPKKKIEKSLEAYLSQKR